MKKYDVRICKCGHIHAIPDEKIQTAIEKNKNLLLICGSCGEATLIGADTEPDMFDPDQTMYMMYSYDFSYNDHETISVDHFAASGDHKAISEIYYDKGIPVPMNTGYNANSYTSGVGFMDTRYPDFWNITRYDVLGKDVIEFVNNWKSNASTVNMQRLIQQVDPNILEELSHYIITGLNWKGTIYEKEYH